MDQEQGLINAERSYNGCECKNYCMCVGPEEARDAMALTEWHAGC